MRALKAALGKVSQQMRAGLLRELEPHLLDLGIDPSQLCSSPQERIHLNELRTASSKQANINNKQPTKKEKKKREKTFSIIFFMLPCAMSSTQAASLGLTLLVPSLAPARAGDALLLLHLKSI